MNSYINGLKYPANHPFRIDSERLLNQFHTDIIITNGVIRWKINNEIPPKEVLEFWKFIGLEFNYEECLKVGEEEIQKFLKEYKNRKGPSQEEIYEMQAAFGKGTTIVDIITGRKINL